MSEVDRCEPASIYLLSLILPLLVYPLLELTRHSAHHLKASEPFWRLQPTEGAARLPGYYACFWPCMLPPLWRRMLHPRLDLLEAELRGKAV